MDVDTSPSLWERVSNVCLGSIEDLKSRIEDCKIISAEAVSSIQAEVDQDAQMTVDGDFDDRDGSSDIFLKNSSSSSSSKGSQNNASSSSSSSLARRKVGQFSNALFKSIDQDMNDMTVKSRSDIFSSGKGKGSNDSAQIIPPLLLRESTMNLSNTKLKISSKKSPKRLVGDGRKSSMMTSEHEVQKVLANMKKWVCRYWIGRILLENTIQRKTEVVFNDLQLHIWAAQGKKLDCQTDFFLKTLLKLFFFVIFISSRHYASDKFNQGRSLWRGISACTKGIGKSGGVSDCN